MDLAPEERVNMSLEELVKLKNAAKKAAKKTKAKPAAKANGAAKATPKKGKKGAAEKGNGKGSAVKVAQVVGTAKAKRAALQAQKRGLNATGKASKMDIDRAVKSEKAKGNKKPLLKKSAAPKGAKPTGLKISFSTADLAKTTDKNVAAQVRGALAKQGNVAAGRAKTAPAVQKPPARSVSMPRGNSGKGRSRK